MHLETLELVPSEIESYQLGIRDGKRHVYARIPERELTVKYVHHSLKTYCQTTAFPVHR
jgi:hypothetical protein